MTQRAASRSSTPRRGRGPVAAARPGGLGVRGGGAGPAGADVATFSNPAPIGPATGSPTSGGPASPYPSPITISGMTGTVTDVNVTLTSVNHGIAQDMDVLLVGPAGQNLLLMSDAAGGDAGFGVNGTLTFDDAAAGPIPARPCSAPARSGPPTRIRRAGRLPGARARAVDRDRADVFNGTNPNGVWNLYTVDDASGDTGSIGGGWSITVTTTWCASPASSSRPAHSAAPRAAGRSL